MKQEQGIRGIRIRNEEEGIRVMRRNKKMTVNGNLFQPLNARTRIQPFDSASLLLSLRVFFSTQDVR